MKSIYTVSGGLIAAGILAYSLQNSLPGFLQQDLQHTVSPAVLQSSISTQITQLGEQLHELLRPIGTQAAAMEQELAAKKEKLRALRHTHKELQKELLEAHMHLVANDEELVVKTDALNTKTAQLLDLTVMIEGLEAALNMAVAEKEQLMEQNGKMRGQLVKVAGAWVLMDGIQDEYGPAEERV
jgi:chromosome segregation ATPase